MQTTTIRYLTEDEAILEFEAEVTRLQTEMDELERRFESGLWATDATYAGNPRLTP